uniref:Uncharacterized protein n=1 Tax=Acrobeloides nanus TaxID=290746 RepID=A0A914C8G8_9BILA
MIICRQITRNLHACLSKDLIYRTPSEPNVSQENTEMLLYRTEDKEIVAVTQMERIRISEWSLCCATSKDILPPSVSTEKKSKISFIVRLAKTKPGTFELNVNSESNGDAELSKDEENYEKNEVDQYKSDTNNSCCHLPDFAERIAFRRESPNEVLYECDVENFYNIVFHWSENSLFDFDGRAIVEFIYSIHLPLIDHAEAIKWNIQSLDDVSEEYSGCL